VEIECVDEVDYIGARESWGQLTRHIGGECRKSSDEAAEATATITMRRRLRSAHP
jgi:hypothetical protein